MAENLALKLDFNGELTLDVIVDALRGAQIISDRSRIILNRIYKTDLQPYKVTVSNISAGSFLGDFLTISKEALPKLVKTLCGKDVPVTKVCIICFFGMIMCGTICYTINSVMGNAAGAISDITNNSGVVGNNNVTNYNIYTEKDSIKKELLAALISNFPDDAEICKELCEPIVDDVTMRSYKEICQAIIKLKHAGGREVGDIELSGYDDAGNKFPQTKISEAVTQGMPKKFVENEREPELEKEFVTETYIEVVSVSFQDSELGIWSAKVVDDSKDFSGKVLPLRVQSAELAKELRNALSGNLCVSLWVEFTRDRKGNIVYKGLNLEKIITV